MRKLTIDRRIVYLLSLQVLSFLLLLSFSADLSSQPFLPMLVMFSEIGLLGLVKKPVKWFYFIWQLQFFLVFIIGVLLYPSSFFNWASPPINAIVISIIGGLVLEALVLSILLFGERPIKTILKGSTISMIAIVVVIILLIGSEGLNGFIENDPVEMLTTTEWFPEHNPDIVEITYLNTTLLPFSFSLAENDSDIHSVLNDTRTTSIQIVNTGATSNTISIVVTSSDDTLIVTPNSSIISLVQGEAVSLVLNVVPSNLGDHFIFIDAEDTGGNTESRTINLHVDSDTAVDFSRDFDHRSISNVQSNSFNQMITLENNGRSEVDVSLVVQADPSRFHPSLNLALWNYSTMSATVTLMPGDNLSFLLLPGYLVQVQGSHEIIVQAMVDGDVLDNYRFEFDFTYTKILQGHDDLVIPVVPDSTVKRSYQVVSSGTPYVLIKAVELPDGVTPYLINDSHLIDLSNETVLYLNGTTTSIEIAYVTERTYSGNGLIGIQIIIPGTESHYGMLAFILGTALTTVIALLIAVPLALGSSLFLAEQCPRKLRGAIKSMMEVLAGIPSVIYGLWGGLTFGPLLSEHMYPVLSSTLGSFLPFLYLNSDGTNSIMTASIVLGIMILPIILSLSYDSIAAVPYDIKEASYAVGASRWQTSRKVVLKHARSGIFAAIVLGMGRAIGETMAVLMIMGSSSRIPGSIFDSVGTMPSVIASSFASSYGDPQSRHGLFSVALLLFALVLILNIMLSYLSNGTRRKRSRRACSRGIKLKMCSLLSSLDLRGTGPSKNRWEVEFTPTNRARTWDRAATLGTLMTVILVMTFLAYIIGDIIMRGGTSITLDYLLLPESGRNAGGGFLNALAGSVGMVIIALAFAVPMSVMSAIYVNEYARPNGLLVKGSMLASSTLASTPSIIFGIFGFMLFIFILDFGFSMISGGLTLACMMLPLIFVSSVESLRTVPHTYREASQALGATKWAMVRSVVLPSSISGVISGVIIAIGRAIGETAAVLLTAGYLIITPSSILSPAASMPNMIYQYYDLVSKIPAYGEKLYAVAFVLIIIVVILNITAKMIGRLSIKMSSN